MWIYFRLDVSQVIGVGHLTRSLVLAEELKNRGCQCAFICRKTSVPINKIIGDISINVHYLEEDINAELEIQADALATLKLLSRLPKASVLIIDNYFINEEWEKIVSTKIPMIVVIDDLSNRQHFCQMLVDQNYFRDYQNRYKGLISKESDLLLGPQYALLRKEFRNGKLLRERDIKISRLNIFFGGTDFANDTIKILGAIKKLSDYNLEVDCIVGAGNPHSEEIKKTCSEIPKCKYYYQISNMAEVFSNADLSLGAGGSSVWEKCILGVPSIVIPVAANQVQPMEELACAGAIILYKGEKTVDGYCSVLKNALDCGWNLRTISMRAMQLFDGLGAIRITDCILKRL